LVTVEPAHPPAISKRPSGRTTVVVLTRGVSNVPASSKRPVRGSNTSTVPLSGPASQLSRTHPPISSTRPSASAAVE
jgi:hypothetical protein